MASGEVALPRQAENIITVNSHSWTSPVPERYYHPGSTVGSINGKSGVTLPVVDLTGFSTGDSAAKKEIVRQIGSAASKFGFFQVVNHGIPQEKLDIVYQTAGNFFELPVDVKERASDRLDVLYGYNGRFSHKVTEVPWLECLAQRYRPTPQVEALAEKIWPGGNPTFWYAFVLSPFLCKPCPPVLNSQHLSINQ